MAGVSFSVFKDKILSGTKRQTIRAIRKNPIKKGETLYLWWKQRSPQREKLGKAKCININPIEIDDDRVHILDTENFCNTTTYSSKEALDRFAISDGFNNWQELAEFFEKTHGLPFEGVLIEWDKLN
jgi:hypothetical protein